MQIDWTEEDIAAIAGFADAACRSLGLRAARDAARILVKLESVQAAKQQPDKAEDK